MDVRQAKLDDLERLITRYGRRSTAYQVVNYSLLVINSIIPAISSVLFTGALGDNSSVAGITISIINMVLATIERKLQPGKREKAYRLLLGQARALKYQLLDDSVDPNNIKLSNLYTVQGDSSGGVESSV